MLRRGALTALIAMGVAPLASAAERLPIDGTYGNEAGCTLARTNNYGEDDSARILTAEGLQTMVTGCSFTRITSPAANVFDVSMMCAEEGEGPDANHTDEAKINGDPQKGYTVAFSDGRQWELLQKCE